MNLHLHRREKNEAYHLTLGDRATRYIVGWAVSLSCDQTQWQAILDYSDGGPTYMDRYEHLLLYADGSVQPQRAGAGVIALDRWSKVVFLGNRTLPPMTNNEAEYMGLIFALETAVDLNGQFIQIRLDSEVVVNQMIGRFAVNSPALKRLHQQACVLANRFLNVRYTHIGREQNLLADALASEAAAGRVWQIARGDDVLDR